MYTNYDHLSRKEWYKLHNNNRTPQEMTFNKLMLKIQNPEVVTTATPKMAKASNTVKAKASGRSGSAYYAQVVYIVQCDGKACYYDLGYRGTGGQ